MSEIELILCNFQAYRPFNLVVDMFVDPKCQFKFFYHDIVPINLFFCCCNHDFVRILACSNGHVGMCQFELDSEDVVLVIETVEE